MADWIDNGVFDWGGPDSTEHSKGVDRVNTQSKFIAKELSFAPVDWSIGCHPPYEPLFWLPGWGHEMTDPIYCRIGEVIQALR
ncbi:MAG: hypothetical protein F4227_08830 [Gammaproteobacteria bacterium]|nr:hypothetical protein [Gammaproteobacteria bacterium]MYF03054.1 hypothetical protein [Gammaproteobacteria bacterium]MYI77207.1 hypothetical protein [Gammaproteobacteria bacterium]